ncbi:MAG: hypothetical protein AAF563_04070 [Pseudomonadota bacterium]
MTPPLVIDGQTKLIDAWLACEDLLDRFRAYNPAFREFLRVLGDEDVARELSLADIASMVASPEDELVSLANGKEVKPNPSKPMISDMAPVSWFDDVDVNEACLVDTRPIFENGKEPLAVILQMVAVADRDDILIVDAPFCPAPLRRLLARRGYESGVKELAANHWRCAFKPKGHEGSP